MGIKYTYYNKKYYLFKQIKNKNEKKSLHLILVYR